MNETPSSVYEELAAVMGRAGSRYLPRIFSQAFSPEQARIALEFPLAPEEIAEILSISVEAAEDDIQKNQLAAIAKKLELDPETVASCVRYMFELGFAFPTRRGWRWARDAMQLRDSQTNPKYDERLGEEYFDLWSAFEREEMFPTMRPAADAPPLYRIIPARKSLKNTEDVPPEEDVAEILKKSATIAVVHCPCKRTAQNQDPSIPKEVCIVCDRIAEHNIRRGTARVIGLEEALAIHDAATAAGLVCMPQSPEAFPKNVCHCHNSCCGILTPAEMLRYPVQESVAPGAYVAVTDADSCNGCQDCLAMCQFTAIAMEEIGGRETAVVSAENCMGCGLCVLVCPSGARTMKLRASS